MDNLLCISPIDGRYHEKTKELNEYFSEYALIKYRVIVEIKWLIFLSNEKIIKHKLTKKDIDNLNNIISSFNIDEAKKVKTHENITNHDVKAVEYYLQDKLKELDLVKFIPFIHFTLTSEDINNTSYNLMIKDSLDNIYYKNINNLINILDDYSTKYKNIGMLSHTHGQAATPTTVGKEFKVFSYRLKSILEELSNIKLRSKFSGAVGNYNAHIVAIPEVDWINITKKFINSLGLVYNPVTTQIESHDFVCLLLSHIKIINNIIKDLNSDLWLYISRGYFIETMKSGEVGSSVMPHKVNPINQENSMANVEIANSIIDALVNNLSISRMQRDLSDSSKMRNLGVIFSHSIISIKETIKGLNKINVNKELLDEELNNHYEVLSEAIQTVLRNNGYIDAYEKLKELSRGKIINREDMINFIKKLDIDSSDKERLINLTPMTYLGLTEDIINNN
ncbi:MAG: adenylosuccinate lyase [Bacilli bacterium]|nr:adenylosuccinate lyase [Bacilli bacterium]